jgi:hypothetical protein
LFEAGVHVEGGRSFRATPEIGLNAVWPSPPVHNPVDGLEFMLLMFIVVAPLAYREARTLLAFVAN